MARSLLRWAAEVRPVPWNQFFVLQELDTQMDQLREELQLATLLGDSQTAHLDSAIAKARREAGAIQTQLKLLEQQRAEVAATIQGPFLLRYERLRARLKSRPWVAGLSGTSCPACNLVLPSKLVGDAQRTREPVPCPTCARLLIWRPEEARR